MREPTPTADANLPRRYADFPTLVEALDYAAKGVRGINFYSPRAELEAVISYKEMAEQARDIGARLVAAGFEPGERLALIGETSADFVRFFLGCQYASVLPVPLPLPTSFGGREGYIGQLARQIEDCGATTVITPEAMKEIVLEAAGSCSKFRGTPDEFFAWATDKAELRLPVADDLAYLQYSSGSTRFPHGIEITHRSLLGNCHGIGKDGIAIEENDRCVSWLPFFHDMGLVGTFLTALTCQVTVDYLPAEQFARRPLTWLRLMSENKGTISYSPTFGYDICARRVGAETLASLDLSPWRVAGIGGDMIRPDVMKNFADTFAAAGFRPTTFVPSYGLAECTLMVTFVKPGIGITVDIVDEHILTGELVPATTNGGGNGGNPEGINGSPINGMTSGRKRDVVNCGKPLPQFSIEIRCHSGIIHGDRKVGRIFVKGVSVMRGYFGDVETTCAVLSADGWLDTGDMGYMLDGHLFIVGRAKDLIIVNGCNHWPQDIEWAAEQLPGVRSGDIAAISLPGANAEEVPAVLVQCRLRDSAEREDFAKTIKTEITSITGINCRIELVPPRTLPRTPSGKLARAKARAQFLAGGLSTPA